MLVPLLVPDIQALDLAPALAHFAEKGFAHVGRAIDDEALLALRERADDLMFGRVRYDDLFFQLDHEKGRYDELVFGRGYEGPSPDYRKIEKLEKDDRFRALIENEFFERIARALIPGDIVIYRAILMTKGPRGGTALPWHQDAGRFWGLDRDPILQIWTALDDAPEAAGCVEVVPESHLLGLATPLGGVVPPDRVAERGADAQAVALPARAGEVLLLHNHVWHRSGVNVTGRSRRAFSVCYMSANTKCTRKKRAPREFTKVFSRP